MTISRYFLLVALVFALAGCDSAAEDEEFRLEPGIIYLDVRGDARVVIDGTTVADSGLESSPAPVTVSAGVPFDVTVFTHTGSCDEAAPSDVSMNGQAATVAVYDSIFLGNCFLDGRYTPRTSRITFASPGAAEVLVHGVREDAGALSPHVLRFEVVVE